MILSRFQTLSLLALVGLGLNQCPIGAHGGTIVSNLASPPGAFSPVSITNDTFWAQQFTSGISAELERIVTQLGNFNAGFDNNGDPGDFSITATLYSAPDAATLPDGGTFLTTFTFDASLIPTSGFADIAFSPLAAVSLNPSLYYWFVLTGTSTNPLTSPDRGSVDWQFADTASSVGTGALTGVGRYDLPGPWTAESQGPGAFLIEVTAVPEPSSWLLVAIGMSAAAAVARRRRLAI